MKNKVKGNMYKEVDLTWNPLGGECPHKCSYCSPNNRKRFPHIAAKYSGEPRLCYKTLNKNLEKFDTVFVCSQNDLFAEQVPDEFIEKILDKCYDYFDVKFIFQTKNPARYSKIKTPYPFNYMLGTTMETNEWYPDIMKNSPHPIERYIEMKRLMHPNKFVTIEPIMKFRLFDMVQMIKEIKPQIVYIGADSKGNNLPEPSKEDILQLISELQKFTNVILKSNLTRLIK